MTQLALDAGLLPVPPPPPIPPSANPNAHLFDEHGKMRRLLWCSDTARLGGPCPYGGRYKDGGECCKTLRLEGPNPLTTR